MQVAAPSFPIYATLPIILGALVLVIVQSWRLRDVYIAFLLLAMWLRYSLAVFHEYTYPPIVSGLSVMAITSVFVIAAGILLIGPRNLLLRKLAPIYSIIALVLISSVVNQAWAGALNTTLKWLYLAIFAVITYLAIERHGPDRVFGTLSVLFIAPLILQWLSVASNLETVNEDRTLSFIGGYQHEQAFSIILLTFLYITAFSPGMSAAMAYFRLLLVAVGLVLANYRTTILAAVIPAATLAQAVMMRKVIPKQRSVVLIFLGVLTVLTMVGLAQLAQDRFADVGRVVDKSTSLIQAPEYFTAEERRLFSGRAHLWSIYISAYFQGDIINYLIGFGPDSWVGVFPLYAHNTFVSQLYELGVFGLAAFIWLICANIALAIRTSGELKLILLSCHLGFIILNMATMPIWTLEGDILYGLLLGRTWHSYRAAMSEAPAPLAAYSGAFLRS